MKHHLTQWRRTIFCVLICISAFKLTPSYGQRHTLEMAQDIPIIVQRQRIPKTFIPPHINKAPGHYTVQDWRAVIDSTWHEGQPTEEKLQIFDIFWNTINNKFACFQDLDVNWDSQRSLYRTEVANGVSRGRFAAIMNYLALSLKEAHTEIMNLPVNLNTALRPGVPLLIVGGWGDNGHFGAGLTPLPDSSLLVYKAVPDHPLGLELGDIVLGYDGIPWKDLYQELLAAQLPITGWWWGCSESAHVHSWLMSAGMNWHLFDTIDIIKYGFGDTLHLSTEPLEGKKMELFCSEQLKIPGVRIYKLDDILNGHVVSRGIIQGTKIGYIYVWGWFGDAQDRFFSAINTYMNHQETTGLIIDFRLNYGGNMFLSDKALELLFNSIVPTIGFDERCNPDSQLLMCPSADGAPNQYVIHGNVTSFYDKPIAVLTGPGAISSGDQVALRMKFHPKVRVFGKPTTAAFNAPTLLNLDDDAWLSRYAVADAYLVSRPGHYLTRDEFEVDEEVWLTPDDVAQGRDTVVEAAIAWINSTPTNVAELDPEHPPLSFKLMQNYPNPFNPTTVISYNVPVISDIELTIYNPLGQEVKSLVHERQSARTYKIQWDGQDNSGKPVVSGVYLYRLKAGSLIQTRKMLLLR